MNPKFISVERLVLPKKPLSNIQLISAAKKLKIKNFKGVFVRDQLPQKQLRNAECGILNLDSSSGRSMHWTAWYKSGSKSGSRSGSMSCEKLNFDSYGLRPPDELVEYLQRPVFYNSERVQPEGQVFCGHLCLYVPKKFSDSCNFQEIINTLYERFFTTLHKMSADIFGRTNVENTQKVFSAVITSPAFETLL